jgi:hypothetical protein
MISTIMIIGRIDAVISDNTRYIAIDRPHRNPEGEFVTDKIPMRYFTRSSNSFFMHLKTGTLIGVRGRLEVDAMIGVHIMCDFLESLQLPVEEE